MLEGEKCLPRAAGEVPISTSTVGPGEKFTVELGSAEVSQSSISEH